MRRWQRLAELGDVEAEAKYLSAKVRQGVLSRERVLLAAYLGHPASLLLISNPNPFHLLKQIKVADFSNDPDSIGERGTGLTRIAQVLYSQFLDNNFLIDISADFVEHVLPIWDEVYNDERPAEALRAARERVSFEEASRIRSRLMLDEDAYHPAAMGVAENAERLAEMARYNAEAEMAVPMSAMRFLARSIARGCQDAAGYSGSKWTYHSEKRC
jgi:hypothetical protein